MDSHQFNIIPSHQINKKKWDECISKSANDLIYAHSDYLDNMADNWHGIVMDDYDCVMPVPWREKLGVRYTYDVAYIQQLGFFSKKVLFDHQNFLKIFFTFIKYGHYNFNFSNNKITNLPGVKSATNFTIDLVDKETITQSFIKGFKQSLARTTRHNLLYVNAIPAEAIQMSRELYGKNLKHLQEKDYTNLLRLTNILSDRDKCFGRKIVDKDGYTIAIVLLLKDNKRLYNIINAINDKGRKTEANYFLYAQIIQEFSGKDLLFDLEGSEIPGVKSFYKKLGAINQPYYRMEINNLPFPLNLIKQ